MKISPYIITGIVIIILILLFVFLLNTKKIEQQNQTEDQSQKENIYLDMREMALNMTSEKLELNTKKDEIFGAVMDWDVGNGTASLITFKTGDASLYLSSGGGYIGGVQHETVLKSVEKYMELINTNREIGKITNTTPLAGKNEIAFYFLSKNGIRTATTKMNSIENKSSNLFKLFEEANKVITQLIKVTK